MIPFAIATFLESIVGSSTCEDFKRWESQSQKFLDASQRRKGIPCVQHLRAHPSRNQLAFSHKDAVGPENILSHLTLVVDCLREDTQDDKNFKIIQLSEF